MHILVCKTSLMSLLLLDILLVETLLNGQLLTYASGCVDPTFEYFTKFDNNLEMAKQVLKVARFFFLSCKLKPVASDLNTLCCLPFLDSADNNVNYQSIYQQLNMYLIPLTLCGGGRCTKTSCLTG